MGFAVSLSLPYWLVGTENGIALLAAIWWFLLKLSMWISYDPAFLFLGIYPVEILTHAYTGEIWIPTETLLGN